MKSSSNRSRGALIDRGANGGVAGNDTRIINRSNRLVDITGIDDHELQGIPVGTAGAFIQSQKGPVIAIFHQYALLGHGKPFIRLDNWNTSSLTSRKSQER